MRISPASAPTDSPTQQPHDPLCHAGRHARDLFIARRRERKKPWGPRLVGVGIHAIQDQRVKMCVKIDRPTKSLYEGQRPATPTDNTELLSGAALQSPEHGSQEDRQHRVWS